MHKHMKLTIHLMQSEVITLQKENGELKSNEFKIQSRVLKLEEKNEELRTKILNLERKNEESRSSLQEKKEVMYKHLNLKAKESDHLKRFKYLFIPMTIIMIVLIVIIMMTSSLRTKGNLEWEISGVNGKIQRDDNTFSDPFYVGLYKFQAQILWKEERNYVGLYLHILKGKMDDTLKWPIKYKFSMVLINQLDVRHNFEFNGIIPEEYLKNFAEHFSKPSSERNGGYRIRFIPHDVLLQDKYYKDDSIMLKISVELV